jgi:hypothetical protein
MKALFFLLPFFSLLASAHEPASLGIEVDSLLAKVGREAVLQSDLTRFAQVNDILACAGVIHRAKPLPKDQKDLLASYVDDELIYLEARAKKLTSGGLLPEAVHSIHAKPDCHTQWQNLGKKYSGFWRTEKRQREGESLLVRELEKQVLIEHFRRTELVTDAELWSREAKSRYPVKYLAE